MSQGATRRTWAATVLLAVACACGRDPAPPPQAAASAPPVTKPPRLTVIDIRLHRAAEVDKPVPEIVDTFGPRETVAVSVVTQGAVASATIAARVTQDGRMITEQETDFAPTGTTATRFEVTPPAGWAAGRYKVHVLLDGQPAGEREFVVPAPGAPAAGSRG